MTANNNFLPADARRLTDLLPGYRALVVPETGSTNDDLLARLRSGDTEPTVLAAIRQRTGKGRLGRGFDSEPGGIYFSFTVACPAEEAAPHWLTPLAGVAAAETLREAFGLDVRIKWVNDLYLGGKKLSGILAESFFDGGTLRAVVGIGINGVNARFPETATALFLHTDKTIDASALIGGVVSRFRGRLHGLSGEELADEYKRLSCLLGRTVTVHAFDGSPDFSARVLDIDADCALVVERGGAPLRLFSGEVSVRTQQ